MHVDYLEKCSWSDALLSSVETGAIISRLQVLVKIEQR